MFRAGEQRENFYGCVVRMGEKGHLSDKGTKRMFRERVMTYKKELDHRTSLKKITGLGVRDSQPPPNEEMKS